jgi:Agenet domain
MAMAMVLKLQFPFEFGDEVELKSFIKGYRGAWFRCKVSSHLISLLLAFFSSF